MAKELKLALRIQADMQQAISQTKSFGRELDVAGRQSGQAGQQLGQMNQQVAASEQAFGRAAGQLKTLVAGLASLTAIKGAISMADDYVTMADRIALATSSTAEYELVQRRLLDTANGTYRALSEAQEVYIQSSIGLRDMGYSTSEALDIVDSLSYSFVRNQTSADKAGSALNALTRAVNRGSVLTDHWATLLLAVPTILEDIAAVSGMTTQEISQLGYAGKLSADLLTEGLRHSLEENKKAADGMYTTVDDAFTHLRNNLTVYLGEANRTTSATRLIAGSIELLGDNLNTVANVALVAASAALGRYAMQQGLAAKAAISKTLAARAQAVAELNLAKAQVAATTAAANAAKTQAGLTMTHAQATAAVNAHALAQARLVAAQRAMSGAAALLGGPAGLAMLAAGAAASFFLFRDSADAVRSSLNDLSQPLEETQKQFAALGKTEQLAELDKLQTEIDDTEKKTRQLANSLRSEVQSELSGFLGMIGGASGDARDALLEVRKAAMAAGRGMGADFDVAAEAVQGASDISDTLKSRLLGLMQQITQNDARTHALADRNRHLAEAARDAATGIDSLNRAMTDTPDGDAIIKRMQRRLEDLADPSVLGKLSRDLRDDEAYRNASDAQKLQMKQLAKAEDAFNAQREATRARSKTETQRQLEQQQSYVAGLEKQAATLGMTTAQLRDYELAEKSLSGALLERAQAANAALTANEQQQQATANAKAAADLQVQLLQASGRETEAALLESAQRFAEIQQEMLRAGNETGLQLVQELIPLNAMRIQLDGMQGEIDKALAAQGRQEQSIEAQVNAGLITQMEGRKRLVELHRETAAILEQQLPMLREMASMPGAMGEQARIVLEQLQTQIIQLQTTTNELQNALRDGLQTGISESLKGLAQGTMDLREAITALSQAVLDAMVNMAAQQLAEQATSGIMGLFSKGADAGAEAASGAAMASAITSAGTAAATGMGISISTSGAGAATGMASAITAAGATAASTMAAAIASASAASSGTSSMMGAASMAARVSAATGGHIRGPGTGTSDSIPAWLSDYEFVTRAAVVKQSGALPFLHDFNRRGMAALNDWAKRIGHSTGGLAGVPAPAFPAPALGISNIQEPAKNMSTTLNNKIALNLIDSPERIAEALNTPAGTEALTVMLSNDPAKFRQILGV